MGTTVMFQFWACTDSSMLFPLRSFSHLTSHNVSQQTGPFILPQLWLSLLYSEVACESLLTTSLHYSLQSLLLLYTSGSNEIYLYKINGSISLFLVVSLRLCILYVLLVVQGNLKSFFPSYKNVWSYQLDLSLGCWWYDQSGSICFAIDPCLSSIELTFLFHMDSNSDQSVFYIQQHTLVCILISHYGLILIMFNSIFQHFCYVVFSILFFLQRKVLTSVNWRKSMSTNEKLLVS